MKFYIALCSLTTGSFSCSVSLGREVGDFTLLTWTSLCFSSTSFGGHMCGSLLQPGGIMPKEVSGDGRVDVGDGSCEELSLLSRFLNRGANEYIYCSLFFCQNTSVWTI